MSDQAQRPLFAEFEDERPIQEMHRLLLEEEGFEVVQANSVKSGLELIDRLVARRSETLKQGQQPWLGRIALEFDGQFGGFNPHYDNDEAFKEEVGEDLAADPLVAKARSEKNLLLAGIVLARYAVRNADGLGPLGLILTSALEDRGICAYSPDMVLTEDEQRSDQFPVRVLLKPHSIDEQIAAVVESSKL